MWRNVGIQRTGERLTETRENIAFWSRDVMNKVFDTATIGEAAPTQSWQVQNMLSVCSLLTSAGYTHTESRGAHFRMDFHTRDDAHWRLHLVWRRPMETPIPEPVE